MRQADQITVLRIALGNCLNVLSGLLRGEEIDRSLLQKINDAGLSALDKTFPFAPHAYRGKTPTSSKAAAKVLPKTGTMRRRVYDFIKATGGATDSEIENSLGISGNSERPRRKELEEAGLIVNSGKTRMTPSGLESIIWAPTNNEER